MMMLSKTVLLTKCEKPNVDNERPTITTFASIKKHIMCLTRFLASDITKRLLKSHTSLTHPNKLDHLLLTAVTNTLLGTNITPQQQSFHKSQFYNFASFLKKTAVVWIYIRRENHDCKIFAHILWMLSHGSSFLHSFHGSISNCKK